MSCRKRLNRAYQQAVHFTLDPCCKYAIISDCHRGCGTANDNFLKNQHLHFAAMEYYYKRGFFHIELGDGEELWENYDTERIKECHSNVYWMFYLFETRHRLIRVFGNHDMELKGKRVTYPVASACNSPPVETGFEECVLLENPRGRDICLLHGHQADAFNSVFWRASRFLVRYLWKPLERFGVNDPTSAAKNYSVKEKTEKRLEEWAKENQTTIISGHTHRSVLDLKSPHYCNAGSCVHPRCITCLELQKSSLILVKWSIETREDLSLVVSRTVLSGPIKLKDLGS